ncbi:leucyl aminopeptidase [Thalassotalea mangrovi]|nr:leucyl aminopeptidase [Thalassotalea mangrovi]
MKYWLSLIFALALTTGGAVAQATEHKSKPPTKISFTDELPTSGNLVLGVYENSTSGRFADVINDNSDTGLSYAIKAAKFKGKKMTTQVITAPKGSGYDQILLVGLGKNDNSNTTLDWQNIGGNAVQAAIKAFKSAPTMAFDTPKDITANIAYGAKLGSYYFDKYYTDAKRHKHQPSITIVTADAKAASDFYQAELDPVANAVWYTRDVSNEPANIIYPQSFVAYWQELFDDMDNIKITVFDEKDMLKKGMGAIYGVGQGSKRPPRMMIVEYRGGDKGEAPVMLVGKGITFDTGGISIKGSDNMWNMKFDMSGAASTIGSIYALAGRGAKVNAIGIAALAENMPGGNAQRPGDVVTSMSGKTIQIRSTDAEGRLVLADAVYYGDVTYNPALLVDLATLTGSAARALGKDYGALFTRHEELTNDFVEMGKKTGDQVWPLPLNDNHFKAIENEVADVMNSGPTAPGASAGAAFIGAFVRESTPWVHLDIAGVGWNSKATPMKASPGSTSFGVQLMNGYIKKHFEK